MAQTGAGDAQPFDQGRSGDGVRPATDAELQGAYRTARRLAYRRLRHLACRGTADDVAQDVGIACWRACAAEPDRFSEPDQLAKWVNRVVGNTLIDRRRKAVAERLEAQPDQSEFDDDAGGDDPMDRFASSEWDSADHVYDYTAINRALAAALATMSPEKQRVFRMTRLEGYTPAEAAEELGVKLSTVKFHIVTALVIMRAAMVKEIGYAPELRNDGGWPKKTGNDSTSGTEEAT